MDLSITERVARYLAAIPAAISGNHGDDQTFSVACSLVHGWAIPKLCSLAWLRIYNLKCRPKWTENELRRKVANAAKAHHTTPCGHLLGQNVRATPSDGNIDLDDGESDCAPHATPQPQFDSQAFKNFIAGTESISAHWLAMRSPVCPWNRTPASFLHALYRKGENIVVFDDYHSQGQALWTHPGVPYDASTLNAFTKSKRLGVWFLCNPVDGQWRVNDENKLSRRSHQNISSWPYLLIESDRSDISAADWLTAIAQLPLPIAAIYETGGRLPHALLRVHAPTKEAWDRIRDSIAALFIMLGADFSSLSAVRLSRLPCCERLGKEDEHGAYQRFKDGPHLQRLLYLNPAPDGTPIVEQKVWPDPPEPHNQDPQP
jgi:hypothetical protein